MDDVSQSRSNVLGDIECHLTYDNTNSIAL